MKIASLKISIPYVWIMSGLLVATAISAQEFNLDQALTSILQTCFFDESDNKPLSHFIDKINNLIENHRTEFLLKINDSSLKQLQENLENCKYSISCYQAFRIFLQLKPFTSFFEGRKQGEEFYKGLYHRIVIDKPLLQRPKIKKIAKYFRPLTTELMTELLTGKRS